VGELRSRVRRAALGLARATVVVALIGTSARAQQSPGGGASPPRDCNETVPAFETVRDAVDWADEFPHCIEDLTLTVNDEPTPITVETHDWVVASQVPVEGTALAGRSNIGVNVVLPVKDADAADTPGDWYGYVVVAVVAFLAGWILGRRSVRARSAGE